MRLPKTKDISFSEAATDFHIIPFENNAYAKEVESALKSICSKSEQSHEEFLANFTSLCKEDIEKLKQNGANLSNNSSGRVEDLFSKYDINLQCQTNEPESNEARFEKDLFEGETVEEIVLETQNLNQQGIKSKNRSLQVDNFLCDGSNNNGLDEMLTSSYEPSSFSVASLELYNTDQNQLDEKQDSKSMYLVKNKDNLSYLTKEFSIMKLDQDKHIEKSESLAENLEHNDSKYDDKCELLYPGEASSINDQMKMETCNLKERFLDFQSYFPADNQALSNNDKINDNFKAALILNQFENVTEEDCVEPFQMDIHHDYDKFVSSSKFDIYEQNYLDQIKRSLP